MEENLRRRESDRSEQRTVRRGMYILPSLFTCGNIAAGFYSILQTMHGSAAESYHFNYAAIAIGFAIPFDALDGRIARMTNTESAFGKELDSLADIITFGVAPALLAYAWGFSQLTGAATASLLHQKIGNLGGIVCFLFLISGASRLARFNISHNPQPKNPGRPGRKYFVGMPIPAAAGTVAAVVHYFEGGPIWTWWQGLIWAAFMAFLGFLMVSTWRFYSGKDFDLTRRQPFYTILAIALVIALIRFFSDEFLLSLALAYVFSGLFFRVTYAMRRKPPAPPAPQQRLEPSA